MAEIKPEVQYADLGHQAETAETGIWLFLATEVMFFGGMIMAYLHYRMTYQHDFMEAAKESVIWIGSLNTAILITSSLTMVLAVRAASLGDRAMTVALLAATAFLGLCFVGLKGFEYYKDFEDHVVPAVNFHIDTLQQQGPAKLFWLFYFYATGLHVTHLSIGIILVLVMMRRAARGAFTPSYYAPLEVTGLYWSFVDLVWIFLFALIYPIGRSVG